MTARIIVQSGLSSGTVYWIEHPVTRLGSDPSMEFCLPSTALESHVLTIEFRSKNYRVYNRGTQPCFLAEQCLASGQSNVWMESDLLELPDGQQLAIELDEDPSPSPQTHSYEIFGSVPHERQPEEQGPEEQGLGQPKSLSRKLASSDKALRDHVSGSATGAQSTAKAGQMLVIVFCLILGGFLLLRHQFKASSSPSTNAPEFEEVIREALNTQAGIPHALISQLQFAEAAATAGNRSTAFERYSQLRDTLVARQLDFESKPEITQEPQQIFHKILLLVEHRLSRLAR
jgi:hypothetical protein